MKTRPKKIQNTLSSMAILHLVLLLLIATVTSVAASTRAEVRCVWKLAPPPQSVQDLLKIHHHHRLNNIIDALIGAGDFTGWANILSSVGPTVLPLSATLFIPSDDGLSYPFIGATDPSIFSYHIVPQRLKFAELRRLRPFSRLPKLLPNKSILVTNTSRSNFTLNGSLLSHRDLYTTKNFAVHGVARLLDYSLYGDPHKVEVVAAPPSPPQGKKPLVVPEEGELVTGHVHESSAAQRSYGGRAIRVLISFAVFGWVMRS